jgi:hypothetical protein
VGFTKRRCVLALKLGKESLEFFRAIILRLCIAVSKSSIFFQTSEKKFRACQTMDDTQGGRNIYLLLEDLQADLSNNAF